MSRWEILSFNSYCKYPFNFIIWREYLFIFHYHNPISLIDWRENLEIEIFNPPSITPLPRKYWKRGKIMSEGRGNYKIKDLRIDLNFLIKYYASVILKLSKGYKKYEIILIGHKNSYLYNSKKVLFHCCSWHLLENPHSYIRHHH